MGGGITIKKEQFKEEPSTSHLIGICSHLLMKERVLWQLATVVVPMLNDVNIQSYFLLLSPLSYTTRCCRSLSVFQSNSMH